MVVGCLWLARCCVSYAVCCVLRAAWWMVVMRCALRVVGVVFDGCRLLCLCCLLVVCSWMFAVCC